MHRIHPLRVAVPALQHGRAMEHPPRRAGEHRARAQRRRETRLRRHRLGRRIVGPCRPQAQRRADPGRLSPSHAADEAVGIRFDPAGRPTAVVHRREPRAGDDVTVDAARPLAEALSASSYRTPPSIAASRKKTSATKACDSAGNATERIPNLVLRASAIVAGTSVRDIRYELELSEQGARRNAAVPSTCSTPSPTSR